MAQRWIKLDLRKASNVRKEVDDALRAYSVSIAAGDGEKVQSLRRAFEARIDQLEEFYLQARDMCCCCMPAQWGVDRGRSHHACRGGPVMFTPDSR